MLRRIALGAGVLGGGAAGYVLVVRGALTIDLGIGRSVRSLGPLRRHIAAPPEVVFDLIARPYLGRTPRAMAGKLHVLERGSDMVVAEHFTEVLGGLRATTTEAVRFERPGRITFRLLRGPVPHVVEMFELRDVDGGTDFEYSGELGTDLWFVGRLWGTRVAGAWLRAVEHSVAGIAAEAERRHAATSRKGG